MKPLHVCASLVAAFFLFALPCTAAAQSGHADTLTEEYATEVLPLLEGAMKNSEKFASQIDQLDGLWKAGGPKNWEEMSLWAEAVRKSSKQVLSGFLAFRREHEAFHVRHHSIPPEGLESALKAAVAMLHAAEDFAVTVSQHHELVKYGAEGLAQTEKKVSENYQRLEFHAYRFMQAADQISAGEEPPPSRPRF